MNKFSTFSLTVMAAALVAVPSWAQDAAETAAGGAAQAAPENPSALAQGVARDWQVYFPQPASPVAERMFQFHDMLLWIITAIAAFVFLLLAIVIFRFNAKANPQPRQFSHNTTIEILWTVVPVVILVMIAIPSMKLLYYMDRTDEPEMTLKVTGYQWYWGYEYPDHENLSFSSYMIADADIDKAKGQHRLLSTDNPVVLPVDTDIQVLVTASDVLHAFALPALGLKTDAVPGRVNETWVRITKPGVYFGQCSELCGKGHAYMPIEIHAVSKEDFARWVAEAKQKFADNSVNGPVRLAALEDYQ